MTFLRNASGANIGRKPGSANYLAWWDADTVRELVDGNHVDKYGTGGDTRLLTADGTTTNNGTKSNPALSGDIFGDWREEVIWRTSNNNGAAHLHDDQCRDEPHLHAAARSAVPRGDRLAEHGLQPAAASGLLHRRQHADAADAEHRAGRQHAAGSRHAHLPARECIARRWHGVARAPTAASSAAATPTSRPPAASRRSTMWTAAAVAAHAVRIRFALGATASRTGRLLVNGVAQNITFNPTGAWTTWVTQNVDGDAEQRHRQYHPLRVERTGPGERRPGGNPVNGV